MKLVERTGKRSELKLADSEALEFARLTANAFGVGAAWTATFDADAVKKAADKKKEEKDKKAAKAKQGK